MKAQKTDQIALRVTPDVANRIDALAAAANMDRGQWLRTWLCYLSNLKREYALRAMADIPEQRFKGIGGRPTNEEKAARE